MVRLRLPNPSQPPVPGLFWFRARVIFPTPRSLPGVRSDGAHEREPPPPRPLNRLFTPPGPQPHIIPSEIRSSRMSRKNVEHLEHLGSWVRRHRQTARPPSSLKIVKAKL
jgi:hypothetical protein